MIALSVFYQPFTLIERGLNRAFTVFDIVFLFVLLFFDTINQNIASGLGGRVGVIFWIMVSEKKRNIIKRIRTI